MRALAVLASLLLSSVGCYRVLPGSGGGQVKAKDVDDILVYLNELRKRKAS